MGNSGAEFLTSKTRRGFSIAGASALIGAGLAPGAIAGGLLVDPEYTSPFAAAVVGSIAPWAMLALATGIEQQSLNPFFLQHRVGKDGKRFILAKYLTSKNENPDELVIGGPDSFPVKPIAKILRRTGFDEVPELANVLAGNIGLTGMRSQIQRVLEQRELADPKLFEDYMYWYNIGQGAIGPDALYAHKIQKYHEAGPEACRIMRIAIGFAQDDSLANSANFLLHLPQIAHMNEEDIYEKFAA